nr:hypothetical protein [Thioalkalivibrio sp. HK1]
MRIDIAFIGIPCSAFEIVDIQKGMFGLDLLGRNQFVFQPQGTEFAGQVLELLHPLLRPGQKETADDMAIDLLPHLLDQPLVKTKRIGL